MNYKIIILMTVAITALLLCGSATAATVNTTTTKLVSANPNPDLVVKNITLSATGVKGKPINVVNSIKNQGKTASKGFYVNYYLKNTPSSAAIYVGKRYISSLGAGATNSQNTQITIPTNVESSNYYIMVYADITGLINESNETNNHNYSTTKINIQNSFQDLVVTKVTAPVNGIRGKTITVTDSIKNQGNTGTSGFYVNYYLKNSPSSAAIYIGKRYITSLGAGATNTQNTQLSIATNTPINTYYIMSFVDITNLIKESNETNNHIYSTTKTYILYNGRPVYITSDNIINPTVDNARINNIVTGLQSLGVYAVNYGLGPNQHYSILKDVKIPQNALIVDIYGGACAITILEMNNPDYKYYKGNRSVFSIWINTLINIGTVPFLRRLQMTIQLQQAYFQIHLMLMGIK